MAGWAKGAPVLCDVDVPVLSASDGERRELTERHHVAGTRRSKRQRALYGGGGTMDGTETGWPATGET